MGVVQGRDLLQIPGLFLSNSKGIIKTTKKGNSLEFTVLEFMSSQTKKIPQLKSYPPKIQERN